MHILTSALKLLGIRAAVKFGVSEVVELFIFITVARGLLNVYKLQAATTVIQKKRRHQVSPRLGAAFHAFYAPTRGKYSNGTKCCNSSTQQLNE